MNVGPRQASLQIGVGRRHGAAAVAAGRLCLEGLDCIGQLLALDGQLDVAGQDLLVLLAQRTLLTFRLA